MIKRIILMAWQSEVNLQSKHLQVKERMTNHTKTMIISLLVYTEKNDYSNYLYV